MDNLLYLIDTRSRYCEVGAWAVTQTTSGDLVLRRAISLGSLWDLAGTGNIKFNGLVAVTDETSSAISSGLYFWGEEVKAKNVPP